MPPSACLEHTGLKSLVVNEHTEQTNERVTAVKHGSSVTAGEENQQKLDLSESGICSVWLYWYKYTDYRNAYRKSDFCGTQMPGPWLVSAGHPSAAKAEPAGSRWGCFHPQGSRSKFLSSFVSYHQDLVTLRSSLRGFWVTNKIIFFKKTRDIFVYKIFILPSKKLQSQTLWVQCWTPGNPSCED